MSGDVTYWVCEARDPLYGTCGHRHRTLAAATHCRNAEAARCSWVIVGYDVHGLIVPRACWWGQA